MRSLRIFKNQTKIKMSTGLYENLPLTQFNKEEKEEETEDSEISGSNNIKTLQNTICGSQNNGKSPTTEGQTPKFQNNLKTRPKVSKSIADLFFRSSKRAKEALRNSTVLKDVQTTNEDKRDDNSSKSIEVEDEDKKVNLKTGNQHSTPTSTFDDGYESCNSTPLGSGKFIHFLHFDNYSKISLNRHPLFDAQYRWPRKCPLKRDFTVAVKSCLLKHVSNMALVRHYLLRLSWLQN